MTGFDVIVIGGGVVGASIAHQLAPSHQVLVLEKDAIASGATGKASGLLSPVYDLQPNLEAAAYATAFFEEFDGTGHVSVESSKGVFLFDEDERDHAKQAAIEAADAGFGAEVIDPDTLEARFPGMYNTDPFAGAVVFEEVGWVDSHTFATALAGEAQDRGAEFRTGMPVDRVIAEETVTGVKTEHGTFEAPTVVVAAGWRTRQVVADHVTVPVRPFRYQTAELETATPIDRDFPVGWEHETLLYWRPTRDGNLHVGGRPYFVGSPGTTRQGATTDFKRTIADAIPEYLPGIEDPRLRSDDTCVTGDAASPDTGPIIDAPAEGPEGLIIATGMHGLGIMRAPMAGAAVHSLVTDTAAPFPLDPYRLDRFDDRGTDFGSTYIEPPP